MSEQVEAGWDEFCALCIAVEINGQSGSWFSKRVREIVLQHEWSGWGDGDAFRKRALAVYSAVLSISYAQERRAQLRQSGFAFWVYKVHDRSSNCAAHHIELDGLVLPPFHQFWSIWSPPNSYTCNCAITGVRSPRSARRIGGDPVKPLPTWWDDPARGPHFHFAGLNTPDLRTIVSSVLSDEAF